MRGVARLRCKHVFIAWKKKLLSLAVPRGSNNKIPPSARFLRDAVCLATSSRPWPGRYTPEPRSNKPGDDRNGGPAACSRSRNSNATHARAVPRVVAHQYRDIARSPDCPAGDEHATIPVASHIDRRPATVPLANPVTTTSRLTRRSTDTAANEYARVRRKYCLPISQRTRTRSTVGQEIQTPT